MTLAYTAEITGRPGLGLVVWADDRVEAAEIAAGIMAADCCEDDDLRLTIYRCHELDSPHVCAGTVDWQ